MGFPSVQDFLMTLRTRRPDLARRFDGIRSLGFSAGTLTAAADPVGWTGRELASRQDEIAVAAARFFGPGTTFALADAPAEPLGLPFPVLSTKAWNHVAFLAWEEDGRWAAPAVRKPAYREHWQAAPPEAWAALDAEGDEALFAGCFAPEEGPENLLPGLMDALAALARRTFSYAQLVTPFPGDAVADRLEARLYAVKEWGTPATPAPLFPKYVGRLHYLDPAAPPAGFAAARFLVRRGKEGAA